MYMCSVSVPTCRACLIEEDSLFCTLVLRRVWFLFKILPDLFTNLQSNSVSLQSISLLFKFL